MPKILIIEDSEAGRNSLAGRLQCRGFDVVTAGDGKSGVAMARSEKPDLILVDMNMPDFDGCEVARKLKATKGGRLLILLALIEMATSDERERALAAGCADCHVKPIVFRRLLKQIEVMLRNRPIPVSKLIAEIAT